MIRKTISMPDDMGQWILQRIAGSYNNESEYFRDLVRQDQAQQEERKQLQQLLIAGEKSGMSDMTILDMIQPDVSHDN